MTQDPFREYIRQQEPGKKKKDMHGLQPWVYRR